MLPYTARVLVAVPTRRRLALILAMAGLLGAAGLLRASPDQVWTFDDEPAGQAPRGFVFGSSREETGGRWQIVRDGPQQRLAHTPDGSERGFRMALVEGGRYRDLELSIRVKPLEGERSAGIVWRYQDDENYYLARLNLDGDEVEMFRVINGNRTRLDGEDDLEIDEAAWHTLKIEHHGDRIRLRLDGIPIDRTEDDAIRREGRIGLWVTADSSAWFDDLRLEPEDGER